MFVSPFMGRIDRVSLPKLQETLAEKGFNILNLESDVGGTSENPIYVMTIEGVAEQGIEILEEALHKLAQEKGLEAQLEPIDTLIG